MIEEPYEILTDSTMSAYKYIINDVLDKSTDVVGYKNNKGIPGGSTNKDIASEIYSYFLTHYFKAIDLYNNEREITVDWINDKYLNIIDIGSNIGTVTFAYIDILINISKAADIKFNIIFIEPTPYRCQLLKKAIDKYIEVSKLNIKYHIVNETYENAIKELGKNVQKSNTIILMSNILNWINDLVWEKFKSALVKNINIINEGYGCRTINIEATSPTNSQIKIKKLYDEILVNEVVKLNDNKKMPEFKNIKECYFYNKNREVYNTKKRYYYGFLIKYRHFDESVDIGYIDVAYNKALYTCRNSFIYDNLEIKYVNSNFINIRKYIYKLIEAGRQSSSYNYQYKIKKSKDKKRPLYIDDFINDILTTIIIISEGLEADKEQNDNISFGNRVDKNMNSPYVFVPYYDQFFNKLKVKEKEYTLTYKYYCKIDLSKYYNNIGHKKLKEILTKYTGLKKEWCNEQINLFLKDDLFDCDCDKKGLAQGPDLSHLLANIYLKEFDDWFNLNFTNVKLLRYVDDIEIIGKDKKECEEVLEQCKDFLINQLNLKLNDDKEECGYLKELFIENEDMFFDKIIFLSNYILKSLYKLDEKNYNKFICNPEKFLEIYKKCLNKLGIYLSKEWLNIKISNEVNYLVKMKKKFNDNKKLVKWINKKKIYDIKLKVGNIPDSTSEKLVDKWYNEFLLKNKEFIGQLDTLKKVLAEKLEEIINSVKLDEGRSTEYKSIFKFIINKMHIFKCKKLSDSINDIENYFPYYNKKVLSSYNECYSYVKKQFDDENIDYNSYEYAINIWLLGEYRNEDSLNILQDIYNKSYEEKELFINTLATEAILKIGKIKEDFIKEIKIQLLKFNNYYYIRNSLFILNIIDDNMDKMIEELENKTFIDERVKIFVEWIKNNKRCNILNIAEDIRKEYKEGYPTYPIDITYISL